jgi:hypothetical protein
LARILVQHQERDEKSKSRHIQAATFTLEILLRDSRHIEPVLAWLKAPCLSNSVAGPVKTGRS